MPAVRALSRVSRSASRAALAVVLAGSALAGCAGKEAVEPARGNDKRYIEGAGIEETFAPADRLAAPDVSGTLLDGDRLKLDSLRGNVVVLNFWASWCPPCRAEADALEQVHRENKARGVAFVGVAIKDGRSTANSFVRVHGVTYPSYYDQPGRIPQSFSRTLPPNATPSTLILDRSGRIAVRVLGPVKYRQLQQLVDQVAAEPAPGAGA